ncbi:N-acetylmuramoyl-L-alanine amidase [Fulvivirga sediminis]|uniref:N-acetylmuramoyl-L-alanine amidase n=1 Tax=Fulvivirga sediminis TaxID=2803949 RepID=A0A937JZP0_9BACT|nr:N-acetylmuramoyl-L-alanine amidase [Fulvivirga sediminis]MBL3654627.1 N-acetylmuramoyl-L-alanine amidase [Fulvivirga sediminis]
MKNSFFRLFFIIAISATFSSRSFSQKIEPIPVKQFYMDRVNRNLQFLCKEAECLDNVVANDRGLYIYSTSQKVNKPEFVLHWREMPHFNELLQTKTNEEIIDILKRKGTQYFYGINDTHVDPAKYPVSEFKGLKIALDPGHMAGNFEQAEFEKRYVKVEGKYYKQKRDISFFEANLAYTTALRLKEMLEEKGAKVMLTHDYGKSAMGSTFQEWKNSNNTKNDIVSGYKSDWFNREKLDYFLSGDATDFMLFYDVYRNMDFVQRANKINDFDPDLTLVIHYNASENNPRYNDKYLKPVNSNYSMVFIPGSFMGFEIDGNEQLDQRFELLRLLVSHDLEESNVFASNIIKALNDELKVEAVPVDNDFGFAENYSILSDLSTGVYHRNLYLTRVVKGPIAYTEALYQDNVDEIPLLGKTDYTIGGIRTSSRVKDVAQVYLSAIEQWLSYNQEFSKTLDALYEDKYGDEADYQEFLKEKKQKR